MCAFEITKEDIESLDPLSLTKLMKKMLRIELSKLRLKQSELVVSLDVNDPDGGLDGYIGCEIPDDHPWLPPGRSGWQFKAVSEFPVSKVEEEVLNNEKSDVKPRIRKLLQAGETYVIVIGGKDLTDNHTKTLEEKIRQVFEARGYQASKARMYSSGLIADWVNSLPSAVAYLRPERSNFKDMDEWWNTSLAVRQPSSFVPDSKRRNIIEAIRRVVAANIGKERATIIRLVGLSGIGKTRLIYEALNTVELKELVLYAESPEKLPSARFNEISRNGNVPAIFLIDECAHDKYVELVKELEGMGGRITLVSLDYDIDSPYDPKDIHIVLEPLENDALDKLIQSTVPGLPDLARRKIVEFSEGYPRIAVLLSENFSFTQDVLSPETLGRIRMDDLFDRIIAGRNTENSVIEKTKAVLTMIAVLKRLGWDDEVAIQGKKACELFGISWMDARRIVKEQEGRGVVIKRGRYRYITPLPLAVHLASTWWATVDKSAWLEFSGKLPDMETKKAFLERLADLSHSKHAKAALSQAFHAFDYELLNSEIGSDIFLNLTKADHSCAMDVLERILSPLPKEKLLEFSAGRRNIVWALEKISWWSDTFQRAAKLLAKLADAENETWSNNATGVFIRLFQTVLGGTTVPAWERHSILEEFFGSKEKTMQKLALKGLNAALDLRSTSRVMSGEEQGTVIPPPEWNPKSREDLSRSILSALKIFDKAIEISDSEIKTEAAKILLSHLRILITFGFKDEIMERLKRTRVQFPELEKDLIRNVEATIYYDSSKLPKEAVQDLENFRDYLIGHDFYGLMKRYVKNRLLEDNLKDNKEKVEKIIRGLAEEGLNAPEKLEKELDWLITPEAENGYLFGRILGELDESYYWLNRILDGLRSSQNPSALFIGGYLFSVKARSEDLWEKTLDRCYNDDTLKKLLLEIIWRSGTSDRAVERIIALLKKNEIKPQDITLFTYGAWFSNVSSKMFVKFLREYYSIEDGNHSPAMLGIIHQYADVHLEIIDEAKDVLINYLTHPRIFEHYETMTMYHWDKLSSQLLDKFNDAAPIFFDLVLRNLQKYNIEFEEYFRGKIAYFLRKDLKNAWNGIKNALLANDIRAWRLIYSLKGDPFIDKPSLLGLIPEESLLKWAEENLDHAPSILARMVPLHESEPILHPLARKLLVKYSKDERVGMALSDNWHTESWSGSMRLHDENKLRIAEKWAEDSETSVANWAKNEVERLKKEIETSKKMEEEEGLA